MKTLSYLLFALSIFAFASCEKGAEPVTNQDLLMSTEWTIQSFVKNGVEQEITEESTLVFNESSFTFTTVNSSDETTVDTYDYSITANRLEYGNNGCLDFSTIDLTKIVYIQCGDETRVRTWVPK